MNPNQQSPRRGWTKLFVVAAVFVPITLVSVLGQRPRKIPRDMLAGGDKWADESTCTECHNEPDTYVETGHAQTLHFGNSPRSLEKLKRFAESKPAKAEGVQVRIDDSGAVASFGEGAGAASVPLNWCFGSGAHAVTWCSTTIDSLGATDQLEFRYTWFHEVDGFEVTPGQPDVAPPTHHGQLGVLFDGAKTQRCFGCHASHMDIVNGFIREDTLVRSISCQRCHGPMKAHVDSGGEYIDPAWKTTDREEAIKQCGQCHRNPDELDASEITTSNNNIVRFQPVGLKQSACYLNSEMTCITCHDPHLSLSEQNSRGIWQCVQCHDPKKAAHTLCGAGEVDDCLRCHMPAVRMKQPVKFTDHWIRVRETAASVEQPSEALQ